MTGSLLTRQPRPTRRDHQANAYEQISHPVPAFYTGLGNRDQAFAWLEKSFEEKESGLVWLQVEPSSDRLRADQRFADLVKRIGIPGKEF